MSESYKRYPFEYDIPPVPPQNSFGIFSFPGPSIITPDVVNDTFYWTSADGSIQFTANPATDTVDLAVIGGTATSAENVDVDKTAAVAIAAKQVVYLSGSNVISPANASNDAKANAIGFALNSALPGGTVSVRVAGEVSGLSGFNPNDRIFLDTTDGSITTVPPSASGDHVVLLGAGVTTSILLIGIQHIGKRR